MIYLITGAKGQLGSDLCRLLLLKGIAYKGIDIEDVDITNFEEVIDCVRGYNPDCIIHCAAYTNVDGAEENKDICFNINVSGTKNIAIACKKVGAKLIYISTDYVFNGNKEFPYNTDDMPYPLNVYGKSKLEGEISVKELLDKFFIVRISWAFGLNGHNFVKTMLRLSETHEELDVVCDQIGSPTYTEDLAKLLIDISLTDKYGIYHATNEGFCSWAEFAEEIFRLTNKNVKVNYVTSDKYKCLAVRPKNSKLSKDKLVSMCFYKLPIWQDALKRYIQLLNV